MKPIETYERVALGVLVYEFTAAARNESDTKITQRLKRKKLGAFDPVRIAELRSLKDEVFREISKQHKSKYYDGPKSKKERMQQYVELVDFDIPTLTLDMIKRHPKVPKREVRWFVPFSVSVNHLL